MINFKIKGLDKVLKTTKKINQRTENMSTPLSIISGKAYKKVIDHFEKRQGSKKKWPKLKDSTIRQRKHGGTVPLQDSGRLKGSIRFTSKRKQAEVFTNVKYADYHDSDEPRTVLPRRDFMWVSKKDKKGFADFLVKYIVKGK